MGAISADGRTLQAGPKRNPFYKHSLAAFFLAYKRSSPVDEETRPIGRLAVLDNRHYNDFNKEATAFFYLFECEDTSTRPVLYSILHLTGHAPAA